MQRDVAVIRFLPKRIISVRPLSQLSSSFAGASGGVMNRSIVLGAMLAVSLLLISQSALAGGSTLTKVGCASGDTKKTTICHLPPGNPENAQTLCVGNAAVAAHVANHGDSLGPCGPRSCGNTVCEANLGEDCVNCAEDCSQGLVCCLAETGNTGAACCAACPEGTIECSTDFTSCTN